MGVISISRRVSRYTSETTALFFYYILSHQLSFSMLLLGFFPSVYFFHLFFSISLPGGLYMYLQTCGWSEVKHCHFFPPRRVFWISCSSTQYIYFVSGTFLSSSPNRRARICFQTKRFWLDFFLSFSHLVWFASSLISSRQCYSLFHSLLFTSFTKVAEKIKKRNCGSFFTYFVHFVSPLSATLFSFFFFSLIFFFSA